jgi:hypothetical protein
LVPVPADAVEVNVGGVANIPYVEVNDPTSIVNVLVANVISKFCAVVVTDA